MTRRTTIIAEIGENHLGDLPRALEMVTQAARAGADIVKFQSYRSRDIPAQDPEQAWFAQVELSDSMHYALLEKTRSEGVEFLSAPFTIERAQFLFEQLGQKKIKVASSELINGPLLDYLNRNAEEVFLSTGLATLGEIDAALDHLSAVPAVQLLHCVTAYPAQDEEANLLAIRTMQERFPKYRIGYSDHTLGITAPLVAVALGAVVIEKHFTLDKNLPGTDHVLSATPEEFSEMVTQIRRIERLLGSPRKEPTAREREVLEFVRRRFPK